MKYMPLVNSVNGEITFQEEQEDCIYLQNGSKYSYYNMKEYNLLSEQEYLDYSLIQNVDAFIFQKVEEYSLAITELLLYKYPSKRVFFLDEIALVIWKNDKVKYVGDESNFSFFQNGKNMYVYSKIKNAVQKRVEKCDLIYSSLQVMQSLCWAKNRVILGEKNPDKTILLIEFSGKNAGMGDLVISAQQYIRLASQRGWYPVVNLTEDNQYISHEGDNMWDYYFKQPTDITIDDALQSKNVIRGKLNNFGVLPWVGNPLCNMNDALKEKIHLKKEVKDSFDMDMPKQLIGNNKVLGVIARESDLAKATHLKVDIFKMIAEVKEIFLKGYNYIFLATENEEYLRLFQEEFGDRLLYIEQKRILYDYQNDEYKYVADLLNIENKEKREWGLKYLLITYCLSQCKSLLYSIPCGALRLAKLWKEEQYDWIQCTYKAVQSLDEKNEKDIIHLYECENFFDNNVVTVIYGIGDVAQMIYPMVQKYKNKVIVCDKRAIYEDLNYHGIAVVTPRELLSYSNKIKILITSPRCAKEIKEELIGMGIEQNRIVQLNY